MNRTSGITAFVTTAKLGSFTAAAERLGLTKLLPVIILNCLLPFHLVSVLLI